MKSFVFIFLITSSVFAQYKLSDKDLIKMTTSRIYDYSLLEKYLESNSNDSVCVALLSNSHRKDTSNITRILDLDFNKYSKYILFSLGQLGPSKRSSSYIINKLSKQNLSHEVRQNLHETFGRVCDSVAGYNLLTQNKFEPGIGYAIANYYMRGIDLPTSRQYLNEAINATNKNSYFEILYTFYRITPDSTSYDKLIAILKDEANFISTETKAYTIGCLRKLKMYPDNIFGLSLLSSDDWRIRVEAVKAIVNSSFVERIKIDNYFQLLSDINPNVSRTAAQSLRAINFGKDQLEYIKQKITDFIEHEELTDNTRGELFVSLCSFFPNDVRKFIDQYDFDIDEHFIYNAITTSDLSDNWKFEYITENIPNSTEQKLLSMLQPLLNMQNRFIEDVEYAKVINTLLKSNYPSTISIIADGVDSIFIRNNTDILQQIILENIFEHYNDAEFVESIFSLANLSKKISNDFESSVMEVIKNSSLYSVKSFASQRLGEENNESKVIPNLEKMIDLAFEYSSALVKTNKGEFRIKFIPEVAPVSVGNFCMLASSGYFDDIIYHRVVPNFVIQTGDPTGTGWGGPGYEIVSEFSTEEFKRGFVGMASAGPNTEGSQWFVMHNNYPHLNGRYTVFGSVVNGLEIVDIIDQGDRIISVELERE